MIIFTNLQDYFASQENRSFESLKIEKQTKRRRQILRQQREGDAEAKSAVRSRRLGLYSWIQAVSNKVPLTTYSRSPHTVSLSLTPIPTPPGLSLSSSRRIFSVSIAVRAFHSAIDACGFLGASLGIGIFCLHRKFRLAFPVLWFHLTALNSVDQRIALAVLWRCISFSCGRDVWRRSFDLLLTVTMVIEYCNLKSLDLKLTFAV